MGLDTLGGIVQGGLSEGVLMREKKPAMAKAGERVLWGQWGEDQQVQGCWGGTAGVNSRNRKKAIWLENKVSAESSHSSEMCEVGRVRIQYGNVGCSKFSLAVV